MVDGQWKRRDRVAAREERVEIMRARLEDMELSGRVATCDVTIFPARYGGTYEGAEWLAWIGDIEWLDDHQAGDPACEAFWSDYRDAPVGRGSDPNAALADLVRQAREAAHVQGKVDWSQMTGREIWNALTTAPKLAGPWIAGDEGEMDVRRTLLGPIVATTLWVTPAYPQANWRVPVGSSDRAGADAILREHGWKLVD